ncbi:uncharacterized protein LOC111056065 [Nilaparvata lugens]|uniref:uncharacterized protein LOC111056065 n=1 Tax=Nilaparvata lugens TaxID=108931 RepID=UPI00193DD395|nr:uncharacterized protein LOC111056065 [Nilaparvata lugens]
MDNEKLISLVQEHVRDVQRNLWTKIAEQIGSEVEAVKKRWQGLRDSFRKEFNKSHSGESGEATYSSSWPYYNQMLFLKDVVSHRKLHAKKPPTAHEHKLQQKELLVSDSISDESDSSNQHGVDLIESSCDVSNDTTYFHHLHPVASEMQPPPTSSTTNLKRKLERSSEDPFLEIEKQKMKLLTENSLLQQNPDFLFLQSLLPYLMRVPEHRKLEVRNKIQSVLIDEQSRHTSHMSD